MLLDWLDGLKVKGALSLRLCCFPCLFISPLSTEYPSTDDRIST